MDQKIFKEIYQEHRKRLENFDFRNSTKLVIHFSGVPGSGKTTLAKLISEKFKAVRVSNDDIRNILRDEFDIESNKNPEINQRIKNQYLDLFRNELTKSKNGLIILDSSCDRTYKEKEEFYSSKGYKNFVIKIDISRSEIERRIRVDKGDGAKAYFECMDLWFDENEKFNSEYEADYVYRGNNDLEGLFRMINGLIL